MANGFTYSELKTTVQNYLDNTETTFTNTLDTFIETAEERILKAVSLPVFRKNSTGTATEGNTYLATPSDFLSPFSLALVDSTGAYSYLLLKHVSWIRDYTPIPTTQGDPLFYGQFDENTFILAPTPSTNFTFELHYNYRPESLTSVGESNKSWLSENAPNAMLYGSLVTLLITQLKGTELLFEYSFSYIASLAYLSIVGSIFAFIFYLKLLEKVGAGRAGYVGVVMPVLALLISTIFEDLLWQTDLIIGLPILIIGAVLVINQKIEPIK